MWPADNVDNMAGYGKYLLFTLSLVVLTISCSSIEHLDATEDCTEKCKKGLTPVPNPEDHPEFNSCTRGCRFYTIAKYINSQNSDVVSQTTTLDSCNSSCEEAYDEHHYHSLNSCMKGCIFQDEIKQQNAGEEQTAEEDSASIISSLQNATPVLQVRKVMADVIGRFQVMTTQVLTYFVRDDNTLIAVQSKPEVMIQVLPEGIEGPQAPKNFLDNGGASPQEFGNDELQRDEQFLTGNSPSETVTRVSLDSRRYTYLMHLLLLLAGVSLSLLGISYCLALARHQQRKTLKAANLNLALQQEPLKLVRPEDLTKLSLMEEEEASPLPIKQDLNLNHANV